ncbi:hypothetical protein CANARDRAFT_202518 [[Candida] arabinofermentans NRRL YB-2248]|uniref:Folylpolyglutamate synthase n=1 Tax=[Candida] arabinofermentans NRRL YB-2248 TaxID=983967 RepID=A0A1E4SW78_9ASCO|nr:hypothetical protein CANARDRAFT_202518 [[Candida] arabinofermentans NRRL YB-2248]
MIRRTYKDAISSLNSLQSNFATIEAVRSSGVNRSSLLIPEMIEWTRRIGYKPSDLDKLNVIHVTGTKGKGSTCAFAQSILTQYRTPSSIIGLYTSPHLKSVRERLMINGKPISEELFTKYFFDVWDRLDNTESDLGIFPHMGPGQKPAYFRFLTLLSFHTFVKENVDTAIYEVGVGGEYDSTNIFVHPTACGVTALGIDHTIMLGDTIEEIAWNKGGIYKSGSPCFTVEQPQEALKVLRDRAEERNASEFIVVPVRSDLDDIKLGLSGEFQKQNASLAVALCATHLAKLGFDINTEDDLPDEFVKGLETAKWAGRCQTLSDPKVKDLTWYADGAHTKDSIVSGSKWFTSVTKRENKRVLLFNQQTRDVSILISELYQQMESSGLKFDHCVFTTNITWSSGAYSDDLVSMNTSKQQVDSLEVQTKMAEIWNKLDKKSRKHLFHDIETSVNFIRSLEGPLDVFVCGSLHLVGGFLVVLDGK